MANYTIGISQGRSTLVDISVLPYTLYGEYDYWSDLYSAIDSLRGSNTLEVGCAGVSGDDTEFRIVNVFDGTVTITRKHYVDDVFVSYVTVEGGFTTTLAAIDRIQYTYVNGNQFHHDQIEALSISCIGFCTS